jgi:EpsI family protein
MTTPRAIIALALILATAVIARASRPAAAVAEAEAANITIGAPTQLDAWQAGDDEPLDEETRKAVAADATVNRTYRAPTGELIGLYIAAYARQRPGVSIHSPLHCLPGTGWNVLSDDVVPMAAGGTTGEIRRLVAVRDRARTLILYWYDIDGRMVASDVMSRLYLLHDSVRFGRNSAALVRLVVPMRDGDNGRAERQGVAFLRTLVPHLRVSTPGGRLPS